MTLNSPVLNDKMHYGASSGGGGGGYYHGGGGGGYGYGASHVYSSVGQSAYGGGGGGGYGGGGYEHSSSKGGKKSIALSALTLLAFLFFLHILSSCLEEMDKSMTTTTMAPNIVIMSARKENREKPDIMTKRKGDVEDLDGTYAGNYAEKKSGTTNWEEMGKVVTTRVKTFSKYDQLDQL